MEQLRTTYLSVLYWILWHWNHMWQYQCLDTTPLSAPGHLLQPCKKIQHSTAYYKVPKKHHRQNYIKYFFLATIKIIVIERWKAYYMFISPREISRFGDWGASRRDFAVSFININKKNKNSTAYLIHVQRISIFYRFFSISRYFFTCRCHFGFWYLCDIRYLIGRPYWHVWSM
jgi:hypothetical protein